jgi:hypothetical protein
MAKNKRNDQDIFDSKIFFSRVIKRYGIILLISFVPLALLNYFVLKGAVSYTNLILIDIAILLFACFIGLIVFTKIDKRNEEKPKLKEDERDPFAD